MANDDDVDAALLLDRFVSASNSADVLDSLESILKALNNSTILQPSEVVAEHEVVSGLLSVLHTSQYKNLIIDGGSVWAARIFLRLIESSTSSSTTVILLNEPAPGRLLETAIDVASSSEAAASSSSVYNRVLCLQLLSALARKNPKMTQSQLLQAPNGLHRLGDLLLINSNDEQAAVRNEALLLAKTLAEWPAVAKIWMFDEVGDAVMQTALAANAEEGNNNNVITLDCLKVLRSMLKHDAALADLVFSSSSVVPQGLARLLDLRNGYEFLHPPPVTATIDEEDDLDDLIADATTKTNQKKSATTTAAVPIPKLREPEEAIITAVLDIFAVLLENERLKETVWKKHAGICSLIYEMALLTPPPPGTPYPCAVPSVQLQQTALQITALYFNSPEIMDRHNGLDRLLYIVCTGGGGGTTTLLEKMALSTSALHVIRRTVRDAALNEMLMHTLAPPMMPLEEGQDDDGAKQHQPGPTVVQKLLNTVYENLKASSPSSSSVSRKVFLAGSFSALSLFLTDEPRRSILLRLTESEKLLDRILDCLITEKNDVFVQVVLLRFLAQWVTEAPIVVHALLQSPHATALSVLYAPPDIAAKNMQVVSALTGMLLGLCMEYMGGDESQCGGWTRGTILEMIRNSGVANFTSRLEALKNDDDSNDLPWSNCRLERQVWNVWYNQVVLIVRKRVVQELTAGGASVDSDDEVDTAEAAASNKELKAMQKMVAEQADEIEQLRASLSQAQRTVTSQEKQLAAWKLRVESTPTELDEMLTEYTSKNSELDQKILALEEEMRVAGEKHQSELKARDDAYAALQQELVESKALESETREERDTLREDMTALSQAYSSLEEEYQRQTAGTAATETPAGEQGGSERHQPQGEESQQAPSGSTEVATLRAENTRLRNDAQAADEWMAMAVERMNVMSAESTALQQEVSSLKAQLEQITAASQASGDETAQLLTKETELRMQLEQDVARNAETMQQQLAEEQGRREMIEGQLRALQAEAQTTTVALEEATLNSQRLQAEVASLTQQLESARASRKDQTGVPSGEETLALRNTIENLQQELSAARAELVNIQLREQEEVRTRDMRIQELESSQIGDGATQATAEDIRSRDEEIAQLREANEAAQDWMGKAVEHNQMLSGQISTLTQQNNELTTKVEELESKFMAGDTTASDALVERFQADLEERNAVIKQLTDEIADLKEEIREHQAQSGKIAQLERELSAKQSQFDAIHAEAVVKDQEIALLQSRMTASNLEQEAGERSDELESLRAELVVRDEKLKMLEAEAEELREGKSTLLQKIEDLEAMSIEVGTTKEELDHLRAKAVEAETRKATIEKILEAVSQEKEELSAEAEKNREALEKIESELNSLRAAGDNDVSQRSESDVNMNGLLETVKDLEKQLSDQNEEATSVIQQWEETYAALESQSKEIEKQLQVALSEKEQLSSELENSRQALESVQSQLESAKSSELDDIRGLRLLELESTIKNLEEQLADQEQDANKVISEWQESYSDIEAQLKTATEERERVSVELQESRREVAKLQSELDGTRTKSLESCESEHSESHDDELKQLRVKVQNLEELLSDQEDDAQNVVLQWQESYNDVKSELEGVTKERDLLTVLLRESQVELEKLQAQLDELKKISSIGYVDGNSQSSRISELETAVKQLEEELASQSDEANKVVMQWQQSYSEVEAELESTALELQKSKEALDNVQARLDAGGSANINGVVQDGAMTDANARIEALEKQLREQEEEANSIVLQWQQSHSDVQSQLEATTAELGESREALQEVQNQLEEAKASNATSADAAGLLESSKDRVKELEEKVSLLEEQLKDQEEDTKNVAQQWQESYANLASQLEAAQQEKENLLSEVQQTNEALDQAKADLGSRGDADRVAELEAAVKNLEENLKAQEEEANNIVLQWQQSYNDVSNRLDAAELEAKESQDTLAHMQTQLEVAEGRDSTERSPENSQIEDKVSMLEEQLKDAENVALQWQESHANLTSQLDAAQQEKEHLLSEVQQAKEALEQAKAGLDGHGDADRVAELEAAVKNLEENLKAQEEEASNIVLQWQQSYNDVSDRLDAAELDLKKSQEAVAHMQTQLEEAEAKDSTEPSSSGSQSDRVGELEEKVSILEEQLRDQEEDAENVVMQWQESHADLASQLEASQQENEQLSSEVQQTKEVLEKAQSLLDETDGQRKMNYKRVAELELAVTNLEELLRTHEEEANSNVRHWQQSHSEVSSKLETVEIELQESRETIAQMQVQLDEAKADRDTRADETDLTENRNFAASELEEKVAQLEEQLKEQAEEAEAVVAQWQDTYYDIEGQLNSAHTENEELKFELQKTRAALNEQNSRSEESQKIRSGANEAEVVDLRDKIQELTNSLDKSQQERQVLEKHVDELRRDILARKSQFEDLQKKHSEPSDEIPRQAQVKISSLESRLSEHMDTIRRLETEIEQEKEEKRCLKKKQGDTEELFNSRLEAALSESARMRDLLNAERLADREKIEAMELEVDTLNSQQTVLERENDKLNLQIAEMDDELREANDTLQLYLTNEASEKAADVAADFFREQIHEMRSQAEENRKVLSKERESRLAAEAEAERVRADLAALLGMEDTEENRSAIQQRTFEATETFQRSERAEIESLKQSLSRALEELSAARAEEKEAEERAAKAKHQSILYEQEVVNAKSDFKFLTQTMDEMRESESSRRSSLEYRISRLENEQSVLRKYHSAEMENLRNELSQVNMERDRLFQALKESEKNKEALIHASSKTVAVEGDNELYAELARLRIEKAQLLSAAADEASRIERRLRETRAAAKASADADIILERELRLSAETALENVKLEMEMLRADVGTGKHSDDTRNEAYLESLQSELARFEKENRTLAEECKSLREKLVELKKESNINIERLTEECRQAKARASHLERDGHYEAEVRAEMARLQASYSTNGIDRNIVVSENPADDDTENSIAITKLYDVILKQKKEIEEERVVYFKLLSEHDDLLAMLTQHNLLKASLEGSLSRFGGQEAVDAAIREAEEKAKSQYGKYVKLA